MCTFGAALVHSGHEHAYNSQRYSSRVHHWTTPFVAHGGAWIVGDAQRARTPPKWRPRTIHAHTAHVVSARVVCTRIGSPSEGVRAQYTLTPRTWCLRTWRTREVAARQRVPARSTRAHRAHGVCTRDINANWPPRWCLRAIHANMVSAHVAHTRICRPHGVRVQHTRTRTSRPSEGVRVQYARTPRAWCLHT
jgi:hypothetical protein